MHTLELSYWTYYYRYLECTLCGENAPILAAYLNLNSDYIVDVSLSRNSLSFIGTTSSGLNIHLVDFPWLAIRWLLKDCSDGTISFDVPVKCFEISTRKIVITFKSKDFHLLFSVAKHILRDIHAKTKAEAVVCNLMLEGDKLELAKSLVPNGNSELKVCMMKEILEVKHQERALLAEIPITLKEASEVMVVNEITINYSIDLSNIFLRNIQSVGARNNTAGLPTIVFRFSSNPSINKDITTSVIQIIGSGSRIVCMHTFLMEPIYACVLPRHRMVRSFKLSLVSHLKISASSLDAFGLFECSRYGSPYDNTGRLCLDGDPMPESSKYIFRRLTFESKVEDEICKSDRRALELLLCEARYMVKNSRVLPELSTSLKQELIQGSVTADSYFKLTQTEISTFWWTNYYRAVCDGEPVDLRGNGKGVAEFAVTLSGLALVDPSGTFWTNVPWEAIRCILIIKPKHPDKDGVLLIEMTYPPKGDDVVLESAGYTSLNYLFFYSIAKHLLERQPKRKNSPDEFVNSTFLGPSIHISSCEHIINPSFNPRF